MSPGSDPPAMPVFLRMATSSQASPLHKAFLLLLDFSARPGQKISSIYSHRLPNALHTYKAGEGKKDPSSPVSIQLPCGASHLALENLGSAGHRQIPPQAPACKQPDTVLKHLVRYRKEITTTIVSVHKNTTILFKCDTQLRTTNAIPATQKHELPSLCLQRFLHCT